MSGEFVHIGTILTYMINLCFYTRRCQYACAAVWWRFPCSIGAITVGAVVALYARHVLLIVWRFVHNATWRRGVSFSCWYSIWFTPLMLLGWRIQWRTSSCLPKLLYLAIQTGIRQGKGFPLSFGRYKIKKAPRYLLKQGFLHLLMSWLLTYCSCSQRTFPLTGWNLIVEDARRKATTGP